VTLRWPLIGSVLALLAGAGLAALVLALCGGGESGPSIAGSPTRTPLSRTVTVTRTPKGGTPAATRTPVATGTPRGTPSGVTPSAPTATPFIGVLPEETPEATPPPPPEETETPGPVPTLAPGETPAPSPTSRPGTATPVSPTATPTPTPTRTPTPTPTLLPDLVLLDIFVSDDHLGVVLGNQGLGTVPAGQEVEFRVRGVVAETVTLTQALPPNTSVPIVLEDQVIYTPESAVLAVVDPNNLIPEEDEGNNGLAKQWLMPDVALDLAVHGVFPSPDTGRLLVVIENPTSAPAVQVTVVVTVYSGGATEPTMISTYQLSIEPMGFETVEVLGVAALPGVHMRVVVQMTDPPDADPSNNVWEGTIP
jgi:hypothetical protein